MKKMADMTTIEIQVLSEEYISTIKSNKSIFYFFFKRLFAIFASLLAIVILSPLLLLTFILIKITSKGPAIYKDLRIGKGGKHINVLKFRSMYIDSQTNPEKYLYEEQMEQWKKERKSGKGIQTQKSEK